jgi:hypothetical protein
MLVNGTPPAIPEPPQQRTDQGQLPSLDHAKLEAGGRGGDHGASAAGRILQQGKSPLGKVG